MTTKTKTILTAVTVLLLGIAFISWYQLYRDVDQPAWIATTPRDKFLYGSVGAEQQAGIPYWIWLALPRIFPEYLPGPGGYASLGFSWEETLEMPAGFAKKRIGYIRVGANCATCHTYSTSNGPDAAPTVIAAGPGHTVESQRLLDFYRHCAQDPRFNAADILDEVSMATKLSFLDKLTYRFLLIPRTRQRMLEGKDVFLDDAQWRHSQNPHADPALRQQLQALTTGPATPDRDDISRYLATLH